MLGKMFTPRINEDRSYFILRWAARVSSLIVIGILILFYIGDASCVNSIANRELIGILFFPIGVISGFAWSWHSELPGLLFVIYGLTAKKPVSGRCKSFETSR